MRSAEGQIKLQSAEGQTTRFRPWTLDFPTPRPAAAIGIRQQSINGSINGTGLIFGLRKDFARPSSAPQRSLNGTGLIFGLRTDFARPSSAPQR